MTPPTQPTGIEQQEARAQRLKRQYPDYLDDPDGLERFRQAVLTNSGHDMAAVNHNSLGRLLDTIERLRGERDAAFATTPPKSGDAVREAVARLSQIEGFFTAAGHAEWSADLRTILAALSANQGGDAGEYVLVPRELLREWYTASFAAEIELTHADDDAECRPTPQHMREMEAMLAASPARTALSDSEGSGK